MKRQATRIGAASLKAAGGSISIRLVANTLAEFCQDFDRMRLDGRIDEVEFKRLNAWGKRLAQQRAAALEAADLTAESSRDGDEAERRLLAALYPAPEPISFAAEKRAA